jgi:hypothetical protein
MARMKRKRHRVKLGDKGLTKSSSHLDWQAGL